MRDHLDAARLKISTVTPETPHRETEQILRQLSRQCSLDELAGLIGEALDADQQARKELAYSQARLDVLIKARIRKRQGR